MFEIMYKVTAIGSKGRAPYLLKKSAKLKRKREKAKEYEADYSSFRRAPIGDSSSFTAQQFGRSGSKNVEMEEEKDDSATPKRRVVYPKLDTSKLSNQ
jgi:hypothetical protein